MARSDLVLDRVRSAYERAHLMSALRGAGLAVAVAIGAISLHRTTEVTGLVAALLGAVLATFGWRGGAWRRGGLAGLVAGLPVFVAPALYFMICHGGRCPDCMLRPTLTCVLVCFGTSSLVGLLVGHAASYDRDPRRFALAAIAAALLTGLLGCGTTGTGGAVGIAIGLVAGGVTGWLGASRTQNARC